MPSSTSEEDMQPGPSREEVAAEYRKVLQVHPLSASFEACLPRGDTAEEDRLVQEESFEQRILSVLVASQPDIASGGAGAWLDVLHAWILRQEDPEDREPLTILTGLERLDEYVSFFAGSAAPAAQPPGLPAAGDADGWQDLFESSWSLATIGNRRWSMSDVAAVRDALQNPVHPKRLKDFVPPRPPASAGPLESIDF